MKTETRHYETKQTKFIMKTKMIHYEANGEKMSGTYLEEK